MKTKSSMLRGLFAGLGLALLGAEGVIPPSAFAAEETMGDRQRGSMATSYVSGGLWDGASVVGDGWKYLAWLGYFNDGDGAWGGWIWHADHGWMYPLGSSTDSLWLWDMTMQNWFWTSSAHFPYLYRFSDNAWLWYESGSTNPRWFYHLTSRRWITSPEFTLYQTVSDQGQQTTLAFSGLAMMTGNLDAQSFFPPGKVADYTGFQYLRDNDPDDMGHNTSFLTKIANNMVYILNDSQFNQLKTLAANQLAQIDLYGYKRFPLMKAFRRVLDGDLPAGSSGLNLNAVKTASRELYLIDGQISFDRALLYATIFSSMDSTQRAYLDAMKGKGWNSWPTVTDDRIRSRMSGLPQGTAVAVMTYASDLFSWYAGSVEADTYFCPERQGTYYGGFYIKDAPAIGHEGYGIDEQLTATAGSALCDSSKGYVTQEQAAQISSLVDIQKDNLFAGETNIVQVRTEIATLLRILMTSTAQSEAIEAQVLELSALYGDLDGENNYRYATVFAQVYETMTASQLTQLAALRKSIMSGAYSDGTPFDFSVCTTPFLYSSAIMDETVLAPYIANTDYLFFEPTNSVVVPSSFTLAGDAR